MISNKLYTEKQVIDIIKKARHNDDNWYSDNYLLAEHKPIELPIDEDEKEITLIKQLAEQATMKASAYADGYTAGYERALKLIKWQIEHILPSAKESTNTQT